jgi:CIC family chloride channel protein
MGISVGAAMQTEVQCVPEDMTMEALEDFFARQRRISTFPVVSPSGEIVGMLSLSDFHDARKTHKPTARAGDICTRRVVSVTKVDTVLSALSKITAGDYAILPVLEQDSPNRLIGVVSRKDIISAFNDIMTRSSV